MALSRVERRYLEVMKMQLERVKRDLFEPAHFGFEKLPGGYTNFRTQLTCTRVEFYDPEIRPARLLHF